MLLRPICSLLLGLLMATHAFGWAESGHAIIAIMAFDMLDKDDQAELLRLIAQHPNYDKDFVAPADLPVGAERRKWQIGRIGYWPDVARDYEEYNRPSWHYQLGANLVLGDASQLDIPADPGPLPSDATMETQELHVLQAIELCQKIFADKQQPDEKRAIALCWLFHLVSDLHLPCHAGSLYAEGLFTEPDGDRGANRLEVGELRLHGLWDQLLGNIYERGDVNRRLYELRNDPVLVERMKAADQVMDSSTWLAESRSAAQQFLYTGEVQQAIRAAMSAGKKKVPSIRLTDEYGQQAGRIAQVRAVEAAARIARLLRETL